MINHEWQSTKRLLLALFVLSGFMWFFWLGVLISHHIMTSSTPRMATIYISW